MEAQGIQINNPLYTTQRKPLAVFVAELVLAAVGDQPAPAAHVGSGGLPERSVCHDDCQGRSSRRRSTMARVAGD